MLMGPNDKRALRDTGRRWSRPSAANPDLILSGPIMVDGYGREFECQEFSQASFTNGELDAYIEDLTARDPSVLENIMGNLGQGPPADDDGSVIATPYASNEDWHWEDDEDPAWLAAYEEAKARLFPGVADLDAIQDGECVAAADAAVPPTQASKGAP